MSGQYEKEKGPQNKMERKHSYASVSNMKKKKAKKSEN